MVVNIYIIGNNLDIEKRSYKDPTREFISKKEYNLPSLPWTLILCCLADVAYWGLRRPQMASLWCRSCRSVSLASSPPVEKPSLSLSLSQTFSSEYSILLHQVYWTAFLFFHSLIHYRQTKRLKKWVGLQQMMWRLGCLFPMMTCSQHISGQPSLRG